MSAQMPARIRAVCFDLDNTFWDVMPVIRYAEERMYAFLSECCPRIVDALSIDDMREARVRTAQTYPHMEHDFTFLRKQTLRQHASEFDYPESMADEAFEVFMRARNEVALFEDVLPGLQRLQERYRLFTATNGNADLSQIGISHYFERSVAAREVGALKPSSLIFHKAIEGSGLAPDEVIYVGDDPLLDVEGSRGAGMVPVWINRDGAPWPDHLEKPWKMVASVVELATVLHRNEA
jgi:HAD superfamily hydrolase (TIGR01549 family)